VITPFSGVAFGESRDIDAQRQRAACAAATSGIGLLQYESINENYRAGKRSERVANVFLTIFRLT
jgi:hypothetical protein